MEKIPVIVLTAEVKEALLTQDTSAMSEDEFEDWLMGFATHEAPLDMFDKPDETQ